MTLNQTSYFVGNRGEMELKVLELLETVTFAAIEELQWLFFNVLIAYFILCQYSNDDSLKKMGRLSSKRVSV